jgi:hypothetical protein
MLYPWSLRTLSSNPQPTASVAVEVPAAHLCRSCQTLSASAYGKSATSNSFWQNMRAGCCRALPGAHIPAGCAHPTPTRASLCPSSGTPGHLGRRVTHGRSVNGAQLHRRALVSSQRSQTVYRFPRGLSRGSAPAAALPRAAGRGAAGAGLGHPSAVHPSAVTPRRFSITCLRRKVTVPLITTNTPLTRTTHSSSKSQYDSSLEAATRLESARVCALSATLVLMRTLLAYAYDRCPVAAALRACRAGTVRVSVFAGRPCSDESGPYKNAFNARAVPWRTLSH